MTALRDALDELADEMPPAAVADDLWTRAGRARRRRRVATVAGAFAAIVVVLAGVTLLPDAFGGDRAVQPVSPRDRGGIPAGIHDPWSWTPTVEQSPPGRAVAIAEGPLTTDLLGGSLDEYRYLVVGAKDDTYRFSSPYGPTSPGVMSLLSPDGTRVAEITGRGLVVRDLTNGRERRFGGYTPLAWTPDGRHLAVATIGIGGDDWSQVDVYRLDLGTGSVTPLIKNAKSRPFVPGLAAAWSPDGRRLVAVFDDWLYLANADGSSDGKYQIPPGALLAGPGAWSPDGKRVLLAAIDCAMPCLPEQGVPPPLNPDSPEAIWYLAQWNVTSHKLDSQVPFVAPGRLAAVRVIAWSSADSVVAVTHAAKSHPSHLFRSDIDPASLIVSERTAVVELRRGNRHRVLATYPGIGWLDLAADIARTAKVRDADGPSPWPVHTYWLIALSIPFGLLMVPVLAALIWWRVRRRRARAAD